MVSEVFFESTVTASRRSSPQPTSTDINGIEILRLVENQSLSVIELSAHLRIPVGVTQVLVEDMVETGALLCDSSADAEPSSVQRIELLKRVLSRIEVDELASADEDLPDGNVSRIARLPQAVKIVVAGSIDSGKTSLVKTMASEPTQNAPALLVEDHGTAAVDLHFGRITLDESLRLYLFDANRFSSMWDHFAHGALAAIVMVNPKHLEDSFTAIDYFEHHKVPFVVGLNTFAEQEPAYLLAARSKIGRASCRERVLMPV